VTYVCVRCDGCGGRTPLYPNGRGAAGRMRASLRKGGWANLKGAGIDLCPDCARRRAEERKGGARREAAEVP